MLVVDYYVLIELLLRDRWVRTTQIPPLSFLQRARRSHQRHKVLHNTHTHPHTHKLFLPVRLTWSRTPPASLVHARQ
jgi:hypothetical protein